MKTMFVFKDSLELEIRGGLGNQLFQLAGGLSQARRLGVGLVINETALRSHSDYTRRNWVKHLELDRLINGTEVKWISDVKLLRRFKQKNHKHIDEETVTKLEKSTGNLRFRGWFQESKYPLSLDIAKDSLQPKSISNEVKTLIETIVNSANLCGIHMRFGDFIETSWGVISPEWYRNVFHELEESGIEELHIYSDDIEMARDVLSGIPHGFKIIFPEQKRTILPHELFWTFRHYQYFVSSNSTLSWWASFLNLAQDPKIYCKWEDHLFLKPWIKLI